MIAWFVELLEFNLQYEPHGLYVDGASKVQGRATRIILEGPDNVTLEQALNFNFKASNNHAK